MALHCITLIRRLLAARDLTTFTIIANFYTVELILYRNMCSHFILANSHALGVSLAPAG